MARVKATLTTFDKSTMEATEHGIMAVLDYPTPSWATILLNNGRKMLVPTETVEITRED